MKTLNSPPRFLVYAVFRAIRHPRTPISYYYCQNCKIRFPASSNACPKCHALGGQSPEEKQVSPVPWWGSMIAIVIGIICWATVGLHHQAGLAEVGRFLIYVPAGNLWGLSIKT